MVQVSSSGNGFEFGEAGMGLVVTGRVRHRSLVPDQVESHLRTRLPKLQVGDFDFYVNRANCKVSFFCNETSALDFTVTVTSGTASAPADVALLVREVNSINATLIDALSKPFKRAQIDYCLLEDERSRSQLLSWSNEPPLASRPAKVSYTIAVLILVFCGIVITWQFQQPPSDTRTFNIISLLVSAGIPAISVPLPFVFEHFRFRSSGRWSFSQNGGA